MSWRDFYGYEPSRPREAKGGIKLQSKRGNSKKSWWAQRWIAVLESFDIGARLQRGRAYAHKGQVLSIEVEKGIVSAKVQGSRVRPYKVTISVKQLSIVEWDNLIEVLSTQALFVTMLLSGDMPEDIEEAFCNAKLSLFPEKLKNFSSDCSCPDWSNPCKHIAAVYYLLGEEFDNDPFLIFKLRGMDREELLGRLRGFSKSSDDSPIPEPLPTNLPDFWKGGSISDDFLGDVRVPPMSAALPKRLGRFPFWQGEQPLLEVIEPIYKKASSSGIELIFEDD